MPGAAGVAVTALDTGAAWLEVKAKQANRTLATSPNPFIVVSLGACKLSDDLLLHARFGLGIPLHVSQLFALSLGLRRVCCE
jgi:Ni,Fe-hydrogenase III small subunit